jgi:hypothetical protein
MFLTFFFCDLVISGASGVDGCGDCWEVFGILSPVSRKIIIWMRWLWLTGKFFWPQCSPFCDPINLRCYQYAVSITLVESVFRQMWVSFFVNYFRFSVSSVLQPVAVSSVCFSASLHVDSVHRLQPSWSHSNLWTPILLNLFRIGQKHAQFLHCCRFKIRVFSLSTGTRVVTFLVWCQF